MRDDDCMGSTGTKERLFPIGVGSRIRINEKKIGKTSTGLGISIK